MLQRLISILPVALMILPTLARANQQQREYPPNIPEAEVEVYKTVGNVKLNMYIFKPEGHRSGDKRPAIVFFFGGGWSNGTPAQFRQQSRYLASRGMVALAADYRVSSRHKAKIVDCIADAKSAIRWVRSNAGRLGIDPNRIAASGGSAGGHLAASTGTIEGLDESNEDMSVSSVPNAMVLFNPALVLAPVDGELPFEESRFAALEAKMGAEPTRVSPFHHIKKGAPPTIILHGTADKSVPIETAKMFTDAMKKAGNSCRLVSYEGQSHGFFNYGRGDGSAYRETLKVMDEFLSSLGYLEDKPTPSSERP